MRIQHKNRKNLKSRENRWAEIIAETPDTVLYNAYDKGELINAFVARTSEAFYGDY